MAHSLRQAHPNRNPTTPGDSHSKGHRSGAIAGLRASAGGHQVRQDADAAAAGRALDAAASAHGQGIRLDAIGVVMLPGQEPSLTHVKAVG